MVRIVPASAPAWHLAAVWFEISMNAWNMPMFFFLSGVRWRRSEKAIINLEYLGYHQTHLRVLSRAVNKDVV